MGTSVSPWSEAEAMVEYEKASAIPTDGEDGAEPPAGAYTRSLFSSTEALPVG